MLAYHRYIGIGKIAALNYGDMFVKQRLRKKRSNFNYFGGFKIHISGSPDGTTQFFMGIIGMSITSVVL